MGLIKKVWNKLGEIYDEDQQIDYNDEDLYSDDNHYNRDEKNYYQYDSGWANDNYGKYINGPVKIHNDGRYSEIRCYEVGKSLSTNWLYVSVYVPREGVRAINAYWSGGRLYAQLSDGSICEWYRPYDGWIQ